MGIFELCLKFESEKEKVLPFEDAENKFETDDNQINLDFFILKQKDIIKFTYLDNFYKRYNKVLLDKLSMQK